jgi:hypothetical protein
MLRLGGQQDGDVGPVGRFRGAGLIQRGERTFEAGQNLAVGINGGLKLIGLALPDAAGVALAGGGIFRAAGADVDGT